jgi:biopolymer transport protein ExbD
MKISRKRKKSPDIPQASTADIAFLLIIFFMSTTRFDVKEGLSMVLPPAAKEGSTVVKLSQADMVRIFITNTGDIMLNEENIGQFDKTVLDGRIKKALEKNSKMIFSLKTDREAKYNEMIQVLDRLKTSGAEKISLSTN